MIDLPAIEFECLPPDQVTQRDAALFKELVLAADEVDPATLPALYDDALVLSFARAQGKVVGVGAVKRPFSAHRDSVFAKAKVGYRPRVLHLRTGLVSRDKGVRGQSDLQPHG